MPEHLQAPRLLEAKAAAERAKGASEERDRIIRKALEDGVSATELARATGVHRTRIYQIAKGTNK